MTRWLLTLEALPGPDWPPPIVRLRRAVKALIRVYGLKATIVTPLSGEENAR